MHAVFTLFHRGEKEEDKLSQGIPWWEEEALIVSRVIRLQREDAEVYRFSFVCASPPKQTKTVSEAGLCFEINFRSSLKAQCDFGKDSQRRPHCTNLLVMKQKDYGWKTLWNSV